MLAEMVAWVLDTHESPAYTLSDAMTMPIVMQRLRESWAVYRAEVECARKPESFWTEA